LAYKVVTNTCEHVLFPAMSNRVKGRFLELICNCYVLFIFFPGKGEKYSQSGSNYSQLHK